MKQHYSFQLMKLSTIVFTALTLFFFSCHPPMNIDGEHVDRIVLVEVAHHYTNESHDTLPLLNENINEMVKDLNEAETVINHRIFSCHELSIHFLDGHEERYITDGKHLERISDKEQFEFIIDDNFITKYWGVSERDFCIKKGYSD